MISVRAEGRERYIVELLAEVAGVPSGDWLVVEVRDGGGIGWDGRRLTLGSDLVNSILEALDGRGDPKRPLVDELALRFGDEVRSALESRGLPFVSLWRWPEGRPFALFLSHDVDQVRRRDPVILARDVYRMGRDLLRGRFRKAASVTRGWTGDDPYWNFESWMELEGKLGVRSTFFVMEGPRWARYGRRYDTRKLGPVLRELSEGGWEIGLHGSYYSCGDATRLKDEKDALEEIAGTRVLGNRQHYLRFIPEVSFRCYERAGFLYDSTLGYNEVVGYRAGTSLPFRPYDPERGRMEVLELPLGIQDVAVEETEEAFGLAERVREGGGMLSLLWHQSAFYRSPLYEELIRWAQACGAWIAKGEEIALWWRAREKVRVRAIWEPPELHLELSEVPEGLVLSVAMPGGGEDTVPALPGRYPVDGGRVVIRWRSRGCPNFLWCRS